MNEAYENSYLELVSGKTETEPTIYDDVVAEGSTPVVEHTSYETCSRQAVKKMQASAELDNACQRDVVVLRRMLFFMSAVAAVALLTAAAALFLAITAMKASGKTSAVKSEENDRLEKVADKITALDKRMDFIWCAINSTQSDLQEELQKVKVNLTKQVNNISKMPSPIAPPGFNASQGAAGSTGAGNFGSCQYKVEAGDKIPGTVRALAMKTEPTDKIILGATCSTNFGTEYNLLSQKNSGKWKYVCSCKGDSSLFKPRTGDTEQCFLHYWECPLAT